MEEIKELLYNYWPSKIYEGRFVIQQTLGLQSTPAVYLDSTLEEKFKNNPSKLIIEDLEIPITDKNLAIIKFLMGKNIPGQVNHLITMRTVSPEVLAVKEIFLELFPVQDLEYYDILFPIISIPNPLPGIFSALAISRDKKLAFLVGTPNKFIEKTYNNINLVNLHQTVKLLTESRSGMPVTYGGALPILGILNFLLNQSPVSVTHDINKVIKTLAKKQIAAFSIMIKIQKIEKYLEELITPEPAKKVLNGDWIPWKEKAKVQEALEVLAVFNLEQLSTFSEKYKSAVLQNYLTQLGLKPTPTKDNKVYWVQDGQAYYEVKNIDLLKEVEKVKQMIINYAGDD